MLEPLLSAQSESLQSLADEHTEEFEMYVAPTLKKLAQRNLFGPGAADVYGAFEKIQPDSGVMARLEKILPRFESDDVRQREEASRALAKLGSAGVAAAMRIKPELSPEQAARLTSFVERHRRQRIVTVEQARESRSFLLECLEYDDPAVRVAAKEQLQKLMGRPVAFNPQAGWEQRCREVDRIRQAMYEPVQAKK